VVFQQMRKVPARAAGCAAKRMLQAVAARQDGEERERGIKERRAAQRLPPASPLRRQPWWHGGKVGRRAGGNKEAQQ